MTWHPSAGGEPPSDEILAAVDIGTNSIHLVVARALPNSGFEVLDSEKEMIRLGSGPGDMKRLERDAIDRAVDALRRFRQVADRFDAPIRAVATSAVREALNRDELTSRAWAEAGVDVEVISGVEEARLIHLGVLQAVPVFDKRLLLVDIGGGSTELLVGERGEALAARSLKLGALRLTQRFFVSNRLLDSRVEACRRFVRAELVTFALEVRRLGYDVAIGSSGTVTSVASMAQAARGEPRPQTFNNFVLGAAEITAVVERLAEARTLDERARTPGLDPTRADIALAGALILDEVCRELGVEQLVVSEFALREGVLLDAWERSSRGSIQHLHDLRRRGVTQLAEACDDDPVHSAHVAGLALRLYDDLAERLALGPEAREYLEAAALLANVGLFVSHANHHKHSYYVIRNSEHLVGFTDREIELIAQVARYHRKSEPKRKHESFVRLRDDDRRLVRSLAAVLRVAIGLDRNHAGLVADVRAEVVEGTLAVVVVPRPGADVSLELYATGLRTGLLEQVTGLGVVVELDSLRAVPDPE